MKRRRGELKDGDWLYQNYWEEGLSTHGIAAIIGCSADMVSDALRRLGIPARTLFDARQNRRPYIELRDREWLEEKYWEEGLSMAKIADIIGCSKNSVRNALKHFGIQIRSHSEAHKSEYLSEETKNKMREARRHLKIPKHHTKPETIWQEIAIEMHSLPFKYTGDGAFWIGENPSLNPDFIHLTKKIAIEIFSYHHNELQRHCKVRYSQTYEGRKKILKKYGWKMIVFWQDDLEQEDAEKHILRVLKEEKVI